MNIFYFVGAVCAYLIGSVSTAILYGRGVHGIDVRQHGSGNAGATNTFRVLGKKAGGIVFAIDVCKGFLATSIADLLICQGYISGDYLVLTKIFFGISCVMGHIFPLFHSFKGGKGVATLLGMGLSLNPIGALLCLAIFFVILLTTKYVSVGSITAGLAFPIICTIQHQDSILIGLGVIIFLLLVYTHRANIKRLIAHSESKTYLFGKKPE